MDRPAICGERHNRREPEIQLDHYRRIVILTGAGISSASGSSTGCSSGACSNELRLTDQGAAKAVRRDPAGVWAFFADARSRLARAAPNPAHLALAALERRLHAEQRLTLITQNVDGLHRLAGSRRVVELHGTLRRSRCTRCAYERLEELASASADCPRCPACSACLRPAITLVDEPLPVAAELSARSALRQCDLFLAVGTSGTRYPAPDLAREADLAGARTIYVNLEPLVPHDAAYQELFLGRAEELLPALLGSAGRSESATWHSP